MRVTANGLEGAIQANARLATTVQSGRALAVHGRPFRRAALVAVDLLGLAPIVLCIPFAILAIGIPIALCVRLLLWLGGLL